MLRAQVTQCLSAAAEEILGLFERSIAEFEQEVLLFTHHSSSQQRGPGAGVQLGSLKTDSTQEGQLLDSGFVSVYVKDEDHEEEPSVFYPGLTEGKREDTNVSECEAEAGCSSDPLTQPNTNLLEHDGSDSDCTDHSEDYSQEQVPGKRSFAMIPPDICNTELPFRCLDCGRRFKWKSNLRIHMLSHLPTPEHLCLVCERSFLKKSDLSRHQFTVHHLCPVCSVQCVDRARFKEHLTTHAEDGSLDPTAHIFTEIGKPFICPKCGKRFRANSYLQRHMLVHTDERPHKCSDCDKCFKEMANLRKHKLVCRTRSENNGECPFECLQCGERFISKYRLRKHQKVDHEIK